MKIFEGKSPTEKKKIIAAIALGALAVLALAYTFGGSFFGSKTKVTVSTSPSPSPSAAKTADAPQVASLPTQDEADFVYQTTPVVYNPSMFYAPDAGRNIFAFYEPPPKTPDMSTPVIVTPKPITPTPTPPVLISYISPQGAFAGSKGFLLEVNGDKFPADVRIIFNGGEIPTTYVSPQRVTANIPANFISGEGVRTIMVRTPDGKIYSNQVMLNVQAPPTPQFQYIGAKLTARANNNTAYFQEQGKDKPFSARLNDLVSGRFKLISISSAEVIFEDVNLGFRHRLSLYRPAAGATISTKNDNPTFQNQPNPTIPVYNTDIPGIPNTYPRYNPTNTNTAPIQQKQQQKQLDDDNDDGDN